LYTVKTREDADEMSRPVFRPFYAARTQRNNTTLVLEVQNVTASLLTRHSDRQNIKEKEQCSLQKVRSHNVVFMTSVTETVGLNQKMQYDFAIVPTFLCSIWQAEYYM